MSSFPNGILFSLCSIVSCHTSESTVNFGLEDFRFFAFRIVTNQLTACHNSRVDMVSLRCKLDAFNIRKAVYDGNKKKKQKGWTINPPMINLIHVPVTITCQ